MRIKLIYILLINLLTITSAFSQWVQTDGPYGDVKIASLFVNNNILYASSSCGLYMTSDPSSPWTALANIAIETYDITGNTVYFGQRNSGIQKLNLMDPTMTIDKLGLAGYSLTTIEDGGTCLFASDGSFFWQSTGYTKAWLDKSLGLPPKNIAPAGQPDHWIFPINDIETIDNWVFAATHRGISKANINTMMWRASSDGMPVQNVQMIKAIDGVLYAGSVNDLFRSRDNGTTWEILFDAPNSIVSVTKKDDQLYCSTDGSGIFISTNNGSNWTALNNGLTDPYVTAMTFVNDMLVCGTKTQGVFYYDGTTWTRNSKGMICSDIWSMTTTSTSIIASDETNVYASTGNSNSWQTITPVVDKHYFGSVASMGDRIFLAYMDDDNMQDVMYSDGSSWTNLATTPSFVSNDTYQMVTHGNTLYVYDDGNFYSTNNLGASWNQLGDGTNKSSNFNDFIIFNNIPFAAKNGNSELVRLDNSQWVLANNGLPTYKEVKSLAYSSDAIYAFVSGEGIFVSRDIGMSWTKATNGYLPAFEIKSFASKDSNIFVSSAIGVFYSRDYGQNWIAMNEGIEGLKVGPLVIHNDSLFVGTMGNGIWKHDLDDFIPAVPKDTSLKVQHIKIFPNPANSFVRFDFTDFDKAQIRVLNILGIEMINTKLQADKQIEVSKLPNGTYVIVITTDRYTYTTKLVIQR